MSLALIHRELLSESRRAMNYWLRAGAVCVGVAGMCLVSLMPDLALASMGSVLFGLLNQMVLVAAIAVVPLITADCISRERREGTLGLLFLTPLTPGGVVLAKVLSQVLRVGSLFLAVIPVLALPFVMGGVGWPRAVSALAVDLAVVILGLACGVLASAFCRERVRALILAEGLGLLAVGGLLHWYVLEMYVAFFLKIPAATRVMWWGGQLRNFLMNSYVFGWDLGWGQTLVRMVLVAGKGDLEDSIRFGMGPLASGLLVPAALGAFGIAVLGGLGSVLVAGLRLRAVWGEAVLSRAQEQMSEVFCSPFFLKQWFARRMSRALDRNPMGWLQSYSWSARLTKWGWCFLIVIAEMAMISDITLQSLLTGQVWLTAVLLLGLSFTAASSFRRERETGALELLLVTPLQELHLIVGRVKGIWLQFLPAVALMLASWLYVVLQLDDWFARQRIPVPYEAVVWLGAGFLGLPVIGLYFSMRPWNLAVAWLTTVALALVVPFLLTRWMGSLVGGVLVVLWLLGLAMQLTLKLLADLRSRKFVAQLS